MKILEAPDPHWKILCFVMTISIWPEMNRTIHILYARQNIWWSLRRWIEEWCSVLSGVSTVVRHYRRGPSVILCREASTSTIWSVFLYHQLCYKLYAYAWIMLLMPFPSLFIYLFLSQHCTMFVLRLRLFPGFLPLEQADWMFSKLLAELPFSLKTNYGMMGEW